MKVFEVTATSGASVFLVGKDKDEVKMLVGVAEDCIIDDVSAEYPISLGNLHSVLKRAGYGETEIKLIINTLGAEIVTID